MAGRPLSSTLFPYTTLFRSSFTGSLTREGGESVAGGPYAIHQGTLALGGNYELSFVGANLVITKRAVEVTADSQTKTYGDPNPTLLYTSNTATKLAGDSFTG